MERLHLAVATLAGLGMAVVIALFAVGYGGNPVKAIMQLVGMSLMLVATVNPRIGLSLLILASAYLDFFKRFLILFGAGSMGDVAGVLSVAPVNLLGVFLGTCVLHPIFSKRMLDKNERRLTLFSLTLIGASFASVIRGGDLSLSAIGTMANQSAYSLLVPIIYVLYRRRGVEEIRRLLVFLAFVYVPVALYGIHQYVFGLSQLEIDYLRSGLTITVANLYDEHPRSFSTLNSGHAFSVSMGIISLLTIILCLRNVRGESGFFASKGRWLLPVLFLTACLLSFGRAGWLVVILGVICMAAFRTRARVIAFYSLFGISFGLLVWKADVIYASLDKIQSYLPMGSTFQEQAFRVGTYSERLYGFQNMFKNRSLWTWFGNPKLTTMQGDQVGDDETVHDAIGQMLVTHGIVGVLLLVSAGSFALFVLHRRILSIRKGPNESLGRGLLSVGIAIFLSGMLTGTHLAVFPLNLLFWSAVGVLVAVTQVGRKPPVTALPLPAEPSLQPTATATQVRDLRKPAGRG